MLWEAYKIEDFQRDIKMVTRDVRATSPFTGENGNQIMQLTINYMYETCNKFKPESEERYDYCDFCGHILPAWAMVLIHGYFNDQSVVEAFTDFRKQVQSLCTRFSRI